MEEIKIMHESELNEVAGGVTGAAQKYAEIVNCKKNVNVRSSPLSSNNDNVIGKANLGDKYVFYGWSGNWARVQYKSQKAYIFKDYIKIV